MTKPTTILEDIIVAIMSLVILIVARFFALEIPYIELGFHCDETDIAYPIRKDTIPAGTMYIIYAAIVLFMIPISELSLIRRIASPIRPVNVHRVQVHPFFLKVLFFYAAYSCGVLAVSVATNVFKRTSSRLRPNFLATCQPANLSQLCTTASHAYVGQVTCLGETSPDEHFSFPSSHASQSFYFAVFSIYYLHRRMRLWAIVRAFVQYAIFVLAGFVCLSRVRDFKHRYTDVVGGAILGITIGYGMIHLILHNFRHQRYVVATVEESPFATSSSEMRTPKKSGYGALSNATSIEHLVN